MSEKSRKSGTASPSAPKVPTTRLITAKELADYLATTERNVNYQAVNDAIPSVSFGRSRRFDPLEVAEALNLKNPISL